MMQFDINNLNDLRFQFIILGNSVHLLLLLVDNTI